MIMSERFILLNHKQFQQRLHGKVFCGLDWYEKLLKIVNTNAAMS